MGCTNTQTPPDCATVIDDLIKFKLHFNLFLFVLNIRISKK